VLKYTGEINQGKTEQVRYYSETIANSWSASWP